MQTKMIEIRDSGTCIAVQFILGERATPKAPEIGAPFEAEPEVDEHPRERHDYAGEAI